ncbi:TetR/AcrR family transcriptional regulator [Caldibacillus debilis]|uniref:Transcriptional regulator, TetR family n=1 Tax=Caldibacillus debilis GB1 TaxID=1339248 RepID=A0A420VGT6_9BACI|nr:TetR/AcrR family transcriptional regulator [Caldibacillus debilis]RKO62766.1 transcriptional regulator, TetR family [Caldibacillus debilis GB1]
MPNKQEVQATVKNEELIRIRREQMIKGAVSLFKEKGFHRATTREIAHASGFSIGTLYEYIRKKEDILYLVCDQIYDEVQWRLRGRLQYRRVTAETLKKGIAAYFKIMDEMQDEVLVMYQEAKSLSKEALPHVLNKELEMVEIFVDMIRAFVRSEGLDVPETAVRLAAHNIVVQGQMWAFRRWALRKQYTLEEYTELQTRFLLNALCPDPPKKG